MRYLSIFSSPINATLLICSFATVFQPCLIVLQSGLGLDMLPSAVCLPASYLPLSLEKSYLSRNVLWDYMLVVRVFLTAEYVRLERPLHFPLSPLSVPAKPSLVVSCL
jgi:hypothetical protein